MDTGSIFKGMHNGRVVETDMFRVRDKEYYVSRHTEPRWTPSKVAEDVLIVGCWTL